MRLTVPTICCPCSAETHAAIIAARVADDASCWIWQLTPGPSGYGKAYHQGAVFLAHRFTYEALIGAIPFGMTIDHLCRRPMCVNPDHLRVVTDRVNILAGYGPAALNARKTECKNGHPLPEYRPGIQRDCRACKPAETARKNPLPSDDARHGTANGYNNHGCRCHPCTDAWNSQCREYKRRWRAAKKAVAESAVSA